jgi:hypothetical protein
MDNNIFEYATRNKLRFPFKGTISVEDLWDMTPENLDTVYTVLVREQNKLGEESLINNRSVESTELDIKIAIVKYIFNVKKEERIAREAEHERNVQRQRILSIIADKQDDALKSMSIEELTAKLNDLK